MDLEADLVIGETRHQELLAMLRLFQNQPLSGINSGSLGASSVQQHTYRFHNLPRKRNPLFQGRERLMVHLTGLLEPSKTPTDLTSIVLCGMGGIGKTEIALHYAWSTIDSYDVVLWISAESSIKLAESYGALAHRLGAPQDIRSADPLREMLKDWLLKVGKAGKHILCGQLAEWKV